MATKLKRENEDSVSPPTPDVILATLEAQIKKYNDAVDLARDHAAERTEAYAQFGATQTLLVHHDLKMTKDGFERHASRVEAIGGRLVDGVSRFDAQLGEAVSNTAYLRERADEDVAYREGQSQQQEERDERILKALRSAQLTMQMLVEGEAQNRTLLTKFLMDSKSELAQPWAGNLLYSCY